MSDRQRVDDAQIVEILRRSRVEDVVGEITVLEVTPSGLLAGRCPLHADGPRLALIVHPARGAWRCGWCQRGGDAIDFVRAFALVGFDAAIELLRDRLERQTAGWRR